MTHPRRSLRDEEQGSLRHDVVLQVPILLGGLEQRLRQRQARVVDDEVDTAERQHRLVERRLNRGLIGDVRRDADGDIGVSELCRGGLGLFEIEVGDDDAGALLREASGDRLADAAGGARDERDATGVGLRLRQTLQLRLFESPVLDAELLLIGDRRVG